MMTSKKRIKLLIWLYTKIDISFWLKNEPFYHINDGLKNFLILRLAFILHQLGLLILFYRIDVLLFEYNYEFYDSFMLIKIKIVYIIRKYHVRIF